MTGGQINLSSPVLLCILTSMLFSPLQVALIGQEPVLFARTVKENITYGLKDVPMEAVVEAAIKANAHGFITSFPEGYETSKHFLHVVVLAIEEGQKVI